MTSNQYNFGLDDDDNEDEDERQETAGNVFDIKELLYAWRDDSPDNLYYLDTETGAVRLVNRNLFDLRELTDDLEKNKERYLYLPKPESKKLKEDLRDFQKLVEDEKTRNVLDMAFESPHVLSAFKKILGSSVEELDQFLEGRTRLRIRQWMEANSLKDRWLI